MATKGFILVMSGLFLLSDGARTSVKSRIDAKSENAMQIGPEGETWEKNTKYVCTQKWNAPEIYRWLRSTPGKFFRNFCLVKYDEAVPTSNFTHAADISSCAFSNSKMKVCPLKGEALERRLSYSSRVAVSKGCFRVSDVSAAYAVIEVALDENQCEEASKQPEEQQIIQPKLTTTTTSTTKPNLEDPDDELLECKTLFTDESHGFFTWNFKNKAYKCCTSTAGKRTKLQDMKADELPSVRYFVTWLFTRASGCGSMFGDTYHNGLGGYNGAAPSCLVPASLLKDIAGEEYETIRAELER